MEECWRLESRRASKGKEMVLSPHLIFNSNVKPCMRSVNSYVHVLMSNYGFKYHNHSRVGFHDVLTLPRDRKVDMSLGVTQEV